MIHEGHDNLLIVLEVVLDEAVELGLLRLRLLCLLALLHKQIGTSMDISFCSRAFSLTLSREVSLRFTWRTRFTVFSYLVRMKLIRASTAYLVGGVP